MSNEDGFNSLSNFSPKPVQPVEPARSVNPEAVRFIGTYTLKVAPSTNQVTLPKSCKKAVEDGSEGHLILVPRDDVQYWQLFTQTVFNRIVEDTKKNPRLTEEKRKFAAQKLARSASHVEPDTQGRFVLPKAFAEKLGESNEVVFESAHTHLKLWSKPDYCTEEERIKKLEQDEMKDVMKDVLDI
jgi:DNA-binding transcriptional regulator/RsmH inhibitor MraZ